MRLLIDSHVFLWWVLADRRLSANAAAARVDAGNPSQVGSGRDVGNSPTP